MATAPTTPTTAVSAANFVDSIGVNIHLPYDWTSYGNLSVVESSLAYLGIHNVRDSLVPWPQTQPDYQALMSLGYKFDFIIPIASIDIAGFVSLADSYAKSNPGSILALEGPNEVNLWPVTYNGGSSLANAAQYEQAFYSAIRADSNLNGISVYNLSLGSSDPNLFKQLGDLSSSADFANSHAYLRDNVAPAYTENVLFPLPKIDTPGLPMVITETGYTTNPYAGYNGIDEAGQAKYTLDTLMDAYKAGVSKTFLYELLDQYSDPTFTSAENHYGLFNSDGTPKLAATAIHDLTTILADPGVTASFTPGSLSYTITNLTAPYGNQLLFEKSNGAFDLVLWAEPIIWNASTYTAVAAPHDITTVSFGQVEGTVFVFDPLLGSTPIATYHNVQQINVDITDHPIVIEVGSASQTVAVPVPPVIAGFSPDSNIVSDNITNASILTLTGSAAANSTVTLFDGTIRLGTATTNASGGWSFTTGTLANGVHSFTTTDTDALGNVSTASQALAVTVDTIKPNAPVIASDAIVGANEVLLAGTAEANSTVNIFDGTAQLGTATVNSSGAWNFTTGHLADGAHTFTATDTDVAGNTSLASLAVDPIIHTVNTTEVAPALTPAFTNLVAGSHSRVTLSGTSEANSTISIYDGTNTKPLGTAMADANGIWSLTSAKLSNTVHNFTLKAVDVAGNTGVGTGVAYLGTTGNNTIKVGPSNDIATGNGGADTFVFGTSLGNDIITDFYASGRSHDVLQFSHNTFRSFAAVLAHAAQVGSDVVITVDAADTVTLKNVHLSSLQKTDIHIV